MAKEDVSGDDQHVIIEEDPPESLVSVPESNEPGEGGKLKMIVQLLKRCLGVKDLAAIPDYFAAINDSEDPFERMLAAVRFTFTKDLKFVHGKVVKPYNSVLGEHFRAHWDVPPIAYSDESSQPIPLTHTTIAPPSTVNLSETASVKSGRSSKSTRSGWSAFSKGKASTAATSLQQQPTEATANVAAQMSNLSLGNDKEAEPLRVIYVTEQVSHHPPVSAYFATCPKKHLELSGIDQISAKVAGTTVKISPGQYNKGIFVKITGGFGEGERYNITHPVAFVNGILRGTFYATVSESTIITCTGGKPGNKFRAIIEYKEESWLGKAHFLIEGVIHVVHEGETEHQEWTRVKHVPSHRVVAVFDGTWHGHIRWRRVGVGSYPGVLSSSASSPSPSHEQLPTPKIPSHAASRADVSHTDSEYMTLIDLSALQVIPKEVRPLERQLPYESRKLWNKVTDHLLKKEYSEATKEKVSIEQKQRDLAAERKKKGIEFVPRFFTKEISAGYAALTEEGRKAVEEELAEPSSDCMKDPKGVKANS